MDKVLVTGGAGFIGSNLADRLLADGRDVLIVDNLSRPGVESNLAWLEARHPGRARFCHGDVREPAAWRDLLPGVTQVYHLAAQVAVTTSLAAPVVDFDINARGTLLLLEELRRMPQPPGLVFTSTNKVFGALEDVALVAAGTRYAPRDPELAAHGIGPGRPLAFHSPYGCSKGCADQYVLDYAHCFGLRATVFRMSCIYGPRQMGNEDQGWVAHFALRALDRRPITIYGDGLQVRDLLFVDDLVEAFVLAARHRDELAGRAFTIGGGPANAMSLTEVIDLIAALHERRPDVRAGAWRTGDQRWYVSDTRAFAEATGWSPRVGVRDGVRRLDLWLRELLGERQRAAAGGTA